MYRKFKKLINNPKVFWKDSKYNLKKKRLSQKYILNGYKTKDQSILLKPILEEFNFNYIIKQLNNYDIQGIYIIPPSRHTKPLLCILEQEKKTFLHEFMKFIYDEGMEIRYKTSNKYKDPENLNSLWRAISSVKSLDIEISAKRVLDYNNILYLKVQFWTEEAEYYFAHNENLISRKLWKSTAKEKGLFCGDEIKDYRSIMNYSHENEINFNIDLVFTWVNSDDEDWQILYKEHKPELNTDATSTSRFLNRDELKYALRSWAKYGKFINNIYIVSNCKPPKWLNLKNKRINWIYHEEIIDTKYLPTFSSHAIETSLHKIPGLSNYFIYSNDDILLLKPLEANDFYYSNGIAKLRLENYGNVNGEIRESDPDYLNAARNSNKLLEKHFKKTTTQLHTHSPQSMRVDILNKMEEEFFSYFEQTRNNKFRKFNDISVTSYFYQHYALLSGSALQSNSKTELVLQKHNFKAKLKNIINLCKTYSYQELPLSVCINDGADSHLNEEWNTSVTNFLNSLFPEKSEFENQETQ